MDERLRQEYLQRLGIESYFPRRPMPGAAASTLALRQVRQQAGIKPEPAPPQIPDISPAAQVPPAQSNALKQARPEDRNTRSAPPAQARETQPADEVRFQLAFIRVSDKLLALVSLPYMQDNKTLNSSQKRLFRNLCLALSLPVDDLDFSIKAFRWPFTEAAFMDKSEAAARAALNTYLSQLHEDLDFSHLLLLGSNIENLVADYKQQLDGELLVCRSLDEMLKMPALKRETWSKLRVLARQS